MPVRMQHVKEHPGDAKMVRSIKCGVGSDTRLAYCVALKPVFADCTSSTCANDTQFVETLMGEQETHCLLTSSERTHYEKPACPVCLC